MAAWYDRHILPRLLCCACGAPSIREQRVRIVPQARGRVLELGIGGGLNLAFYDPAAATSVTGVDPSPELRAIAEAAPRPQGLAVEIAAGEAERLPFADASFDTVVCTFTLCSVRSTAAVLSETRRVLRPDGRFLFCEHGLSPDDGVVRWQRRLEPIWTRLAGGCHLTRPVSAAIETAGFALGETRRFYLDKVPRPMGWCEQGVARPA
ncbi:class I SAM-dependent methyltransferase [Caulobacter segnis]|uniref:class I SAM-dependent methyltransferase n=1 Tax=Caulobacter segnis TaxID=88688 RepID=UPI001CC134B1|nr:class I SAM-dependent methyltransferase [Caulobacter segnis]UAL10415.1 class I SAM-dependent methyltransferase [Caulobacter segnis]